MLNKQKIIKSFNASAPNYHSAADIQPRIAARLAEYLPGISAASILEIGCGTGLYSRHLQAVFPTSEILLTDLAPSMLDVCEKNLGAHANCAFRQMDGEFLSIDRTFDLITSSMTLHWFSDIKKSLRQIISKLAPKGRLVFALLGENSLQEWRDICKHYHLTTTPTFIDVEQLRADFPGMKITVEKSQQIYKSTHDFFKTLKTIGASTPHPGHRTLTSGFLRRLMRKLDETNSHGISITYEVIYGYLEK